MSPELMELVAVLVTAAVKAILAAIDAGRTPAQVLTAIRRIETDAAAIDRDVDGVVAGG